MGTIERVIEPIGAMHELVEVGGDVHYGLQMRLYLASLPKDEADRIVRDIEYRNRRRRIIRRRTSINLPEKPQ